MRKDRQTDRQTDMMKLIAAFFAILQTHLKMTCMFCIEYLFDIRLTAFDYISQLVLRQVSDMQSGASL